MRIWKVQQSHLGYMLQLQLLVVLQQSSMLLLHKYQSTLL
jgi:hypothetical protein